MELEDNVVKQLDALTNDDSEAAHGEAETLVMTLLRDIGYSKVADAFERARTRCDFWYA